MKNRNIAFDEDIIKAVTDKVIYAEDTVRYVYKFHFRALKRAMIYGEYPVIKVSGIGTFHAGLHYLKVKKEYIMNRYLNAYDMPNSELPAIDAKIKKIEEMHEKYYSQPSRGMYKRLCNFFNPIYKSKQHTLGSTPKEQEFNQNREEF